MSKYKLPHSKYVGRSKYGNLKFTKKDKLGRNMPFYLTPSQYKRLKELEKKHKKK